MELILPEALVLLALDNRQGQLLIPDYSLSYGLCGALLLELIVQDCIEIEVKSQLVKPKNNAPSDELLIDTLRMIKAENKLHELKFWVENIPNRMKDLRNIIIKRLVSKQLLQEAEGKILFIKFHTYPTQNPEVELALKTQIIQAVLHNQNEVDYSTILLTRLTHACNLFPEIFNRHELKIAVQELHKLQSAHGVDEAVHAAVEAMDASLACIAATCAITAATS